MTPAEQKHRSIITRIRNARKPREAIEGSDVFKAEIEELKRLGEHPAWPRQRDYELRQKK